MAYTPIYDGNFAAAQEVEPSPIVSTDEVTRALLITRTYAVGVSNYTPQAQGSLDPQYTAYQINETNASIQGPVKIFNRHFATVPVTREEPRSVSFTVPGKSAIVTSDISALPIGWNPYGTAAPYTVPLLANAEYSYAFVSPGTNPRSVFTEPTPTTLMFDGQPVDFLGSVYESIGQATVAQGGGLPDIIEERFQFVGNVTGWTALTDWIMSVDIRRWRGPIWEMEVVTVPGSIIPIP